METYLEYAKLLDDLLAGARAVRNGRGLPSLP